MAEVPGATRSDRRRTRTAAALLTAAERALREQGYAATTVEDIAERADVAVGSLYNHFGGKDGVFLALADRALAVNEGYMRDAYAQPGAPLDRLLAAGDAYLRFFVEHPFYFELVALPQWQRRGPHAQDVADRIAERVDVLLAGLEDLLRQGREEGSMRTRDARLTARFLWGAWNGVIATTLRPDRLKLSAEELVAVLGEGRRLILGGLAPGPEPTER